MKISYRRKNSRLGILGGTFDPPHKGHIHIAKIAIKKLQLNNLMWIITKKNPLKKKPHLTTKKRIKLSKEITKKEKKISVYYLDRKVKSNNTFELLKYIKKKNINSKLFFLMGSDNLLKFHKWNNYKKIPKIAKLIVFARGNYSISFLKSKVAKKLRKKDWKYINSKKINISSSLIRKIW